MRPVRLATARELKVLKRGGCVELIDVGEADAIGRAYAIERTERLGRITPPAARDDEAIQTDPSPGDLGRKGQ